MKLRQIYEMAIQMGIEKDVRGEAEIKRLLETRKKEYDKSEGAGRAAFDLDTLFNPFADSRILNGTGNEEIKSILCGIDMEIGELVLADRLREKGRRIDLVLAHHPEGSAQAALADVMGLQADQLFREGIPINVAESILSSRISEVERGMHPLNHQRAVDAARLLDLPFMCLHTPADNQVNDFLEKHLAAAAPVTMDDLMETMCSLPEYEKARALKAGPRILVGDKKKRTGKLFIKMTGGTSGSSDVYAKMETAGIGTVICMHMTEKHLENAKRHNINVVVAGHMASDSLGLNLILDRLEEQGIEIIPCSGLIRVSRCNVRKAGKSGRGNAGAKTK